MRKALIGGIVAAALASAAPASAGCWATVGLAPPPDTIRAGQAWTAKITVLQHGRNPLPDAAAAAPTLTIANRATGERKTFTAAASDPAAGLYEARVVFPSAGAWTYEVFDDFTSWNGEPAPCAQTHSFAAAQIAGPGAGPPADAPAASASAGGLPVWPLVGGALGLLGASLLVLYVVRRHGSRATAPIS